MGHLFQGRYKAKVVDTDATYFRTAGLYILLNPVDAGIVNLQQQNLEDYLWSSYPAYLRPPSQRPKWLHTHRLSRSCGIGSESRAGRRVFSAFVTERGLSLQLKNLSKEEAHEWSQMERGWVHGRAEFREAMVVLLKEQGKITRSIAGDQRRDIGASHAHVASDQALAMLGLRATELASLRKGDERKLLIAGWLRVHFQISAKWCADNLVMGHVSTVTRAREFYRHPPKKWGADKKKLDRILDLLG